MKDIASLSDRQRDLETDIYMTGQELVCDDCGNEHEDLIETEIGWLCQSCFNQYIERN